MISLDPQQREIVDLDPQTVVLVTGEAGSGKTTTALHRLAGLVRSGDVPQIVVPTRDLVDKIDGVLGAMGIEASVDTLDAWLGVQLRRAFRVLADRESMGASPKVLRFKRHPAVRAVLDEVAELDDAPVDRDTLHELWGDRSLLREIVDAAEGDLRPDEAEATAAHAASQFAEVDRHEDGSPVLGMGGVPLHEGTPLEDAGTCDPEDVPILFALDRLRGGRRRPFRSPHLMIDEAQEMPPLALWILGRALARGASLTIVGDAGQQVDPSAWFRGWRATLRDLGQTEVVEIALCRQHRNPAGVEALAQAIREGRPLPTTGSGVDGGVFATRSSALGALGAWIAEDDAPTAIVAVDPAAARQLHRALPATLGLRLVTDDDVAVGSRIVTVPQRLRGLEIERIAVVDTRGWTATSAGRRALYLAVTRATRRVWIGSGPEAAPR